MVPFRIGLTGGIGVGKSTVAAELQALGAEIVSGDELGRQTLEESPALLELIRERFGDSVFAPDGALLRRKLGEVVFARPEDARWLTQLTFPGIHARWQRAVAAARGPVIVLDAALIFEWGIEGEFDLVVIVRADADTVARRMLANGRLSPSEAAARLAAQLPPDVKAARAHVVLDNQGSLPAFQETIRRFWQLQIEPELLRRREQGNELSV